MMHFLELNLKVMQVPKVKKKEVLLQSSSVLLLPLLSLVDIAAIKRTLMSQTREETKKTRSSSRRSSRERPKRKLPRKKSSQPLPSQLKSKSDYENKNSYSSFR